MSEMPDNAGSSSAPPPPGGYRVDHAPTGAGAPSDPSAAADERASATATATMEPPPAPPAPPATSAAEAGEGGGKRRRGAGVGIVLIAIGALLLLANVVPGWTFGQFWPVIIILLGLFEAVSPKSPNEPRINKIMDGLVLAGIGVVFLGNTTGNLSWTVWWSILSLWPVLVISAGLSILGRGVGQRWLGAIGSLLVLGALLWAAFGMPTGDGVFPFSMAAELGGLIGAIS